MLITFALSPFWRALERSGAAIAAGKYAWHLSGAAFMLLGLTSDSAGASKHLVFLAPLHSGSVFVYDLSTKSQVATLAVEDGAAVVGMAASRDGNTLYVVDGNTRDRLRAFDTNSWRQQWEQEFRDRALPLGAAQVAHLTADNRWLLIKTYDAEAAASGIRVFDIEKKHFAPAGLKLQRCTEPEFSSSADGTVAALFPGSVEFLHSGPGETLGSIHEVTIPIASPSAIAVAPNGASAFVLGAPTVSAPWRLVQVSPSGTFPVNSVNLSEMLGTSGAGPDETQSSILIVSRNGDALAIASGANVWLLGTDPIRLQRHVSLPSAVDGAYLTSDGHELYFMRRDTRKSAMLLGVVNLETGEIEESVLLEKLALTPVVSLFALDESAQ